MITYKRIRLQEQEVLGIFPGLRGPKNQLLDRGSQVLPYNLG
jgi:hypothetical protein